MQGNVGGCGEVAPHRGKGTREKPPTSKAEQEMARVSWVSLGLAKETVVVMSEY